MNDLKFIPKFKAFIKEENTMVEVISINFKEENIGYSDNNGTIIYLSFDKIELLQLSNCFDINGLEIATGDIVQIVNNESLFGKNAGEVYEIYFNQGCFRMKPKYPSSIARGLLGFCLDENNICKILGNKYEHPKLLNKL